MKKNFYILDGQFTDKELETISHALVLKKLERFYPLIDIAEIKQNIYQVEVQLEDGETEEAYIETDIEAEQDIAHTLRPRKGRIIIYHKDMEIFTKKEK